MPILVRPVREQLEHDRVIRLLQAKWKKQYDVEANVGDERRAFLKIGQMTVFPDLVLSTQSPPRRVQGVIEVETGESVNHLEAMSQWAHMSKARAPFKLYVPVGSIDQARRLCAEQRVALFELWSFYVLGEQVRFTLIQRDRALGSPGLSKARRDEVDYGMEPLETETLGPLEPPPPPPPPPEPPVVVAKPAVARTEPAGKAPNKVTAPTAKAKAGAKPATPVPPARPPVKTLRPAAKPVVSPRSATATKVVAVRPPAARKAPAKAAVTKPALPKPAVTKPAARKPAVAAARKMVAPPVRRAAAKDARPARPTKPAAKPTAKAAKPPGRRS